MLRIDAALGGQAEPSSRLVLLAAGVGQVVALPLIAWVDSEGVVSADHPPPKMSTPVPFMTRICQ